MSLLKDLYHGDNHFDFPRIWKKALIASAALCVLSVVALGVLGFNLGLEFEGGTSWEVKAPGKSVAEARDVLRPLGQGDATIQIVDGDVVRIQSAVKDPKKAEEISQDLAQLGEVQGFSSVGPSWGRQITEKSIRALVVFFVLLAAFISWRLEWKMAAGALIAVVHDILITVGVYAAFQIPVTPATVVSFLTILGYSLYDTIVVFDKVHELTAKPSVVNRYTYTDIMNLSLNQVLMRSINTTMMGILPVIAMFVVAKSHGADTLYDYAIALLVGLFIGAYSSIFVASPIVAYLKEREPRHRAVRERIEGRSGDHHTRLLDGRELAGVGAGSSPRPVAAASVATRAGNGTGSGAVSTGQASRNGVSDGEGEAATAGPTTIVRPPPGGAIPPRPRKKKRR